MQSTALFAYVRKKDTRIKWVKFRNSSVPQTSDLLDKYHYLWSYFGRFYVNVSIQQLAQYFHTMYCSKMQYTAKMNDHEYVHPYPANIFYKSNVY